MMAQACCTKILQVLPRFHVEGHLGYIVKYFKQRERREIFVKTNKANGTFKHTWSPVW